MCLAIAHYSQPTDLQLLFAFEYVGEIYHNPGKNESTWIVPFSYFVIRIFSKTSVQKQWQKAFEVFSKGKKIGLFCTQPLTYGYKSFLGIDINDQNPKKCLSCLKQSQTMPAWILLFLSSRFHPPTVCLCWYSGYPVNVPSGRLAHLPFFWE